MQSVFDVDVILLLATLMAAKRRPAALAEIIAGTELIQGLQGTLPAATKLKGAFSRLATYGLIRAEGDGFVLTEAAQAIVATPARKATNAERVAGIRSALAAANLADGHPDIRIDDARWNEAIAAHRAAGEASGMNLLVPKPKAEDDRRHPTGRPGMGKRPGPRKPAPTRRRKD